MAAAAGLLAVALVIAVGSAMAADKGLPVPRFVTLRADAVNLRTGPGERYPIEWVLKRKDLPVEIMQEFENWRRIRTSDGTEGWVHQRMVAGRRGVVVRGEIRAMYAAPRGDAAVLARVEPGVVARLLECIPDWCRVETGTGRLAGWLKRDGIWGVYPGEVVP